MFNLLIFCSIIAVLIGCWWGVARVLEKTRIGALRHLVAGVVGIATTIAYVMTVTTIIGWYYGGTIHDEALDGDLQSVTAFVEGGGDVNQRHKNSGANVLAYGVASGNIDLVDYLISRGANVNDRDNNGTTPLHYAAREHQGLVIRHLVAGGANLNVFADNYDIPSGAHEFPFQGAPLHWAIYDEGKSSTQKGAAIGVLLDLGSDPNATNGLVRYPLELAVLYSDLEVVRALIAAKADVNAGFALSYAAQNDELEIAKFLIESGADVNKSGRMGRAFGLSTAEAPLSLARSAEMRTLLIEAGARDP